MLKIGIVGAGNMGSSHAHAINGYGASVIAVHDKHLSAAEKLAADNSGAIATDSLDVFYDINMDGVVIAAPPPVRIEPITMACERGVHIIVEKPPALTMADARVCMEAINRAGVMAAVGFQLRYDPLYEALKKKLEGQTVHLVRTVCTINYYLDFQMSPWFLQNSISGGPIAEQAIHLLDAVRYVLKNPSPVQAHALAIKNMALERDEFDAENSIQMTYELDNGVFGTHCNHCGTEQFSFDMEFIGPHLRLMANATDGRIVGYINGEKIDEAKPEKNQIGFDKTGAWLAAIESGNKTLIRAPYDDSIKTLALVEAAVSSRGTGAFVKAKV